MKIELDLGMVETTRIIAILSAGMASLCDLGKKEEEVKEYARTVDGLIRKLSAPFPPLFNAYAEIEDDTNREAKKFNIGL